MKGGIIRMGPTGIFLIVPELISGSTDLGETEPAAYPLPVLILLGAEREGKGPPREGAPMLSSSEVMSSSERPEEPSGDVLRREGRTPSASFMCVFPLMVLLVVLVLLALREAASLLEMSTDWGASLEVGAFARGGLPRALSAAATCNKREQRKGKDNEDEPCTLPWKLVGCQP